MQRLDLTDWKALRAFYDNARKHELSRFILEGLIIYPFDAGIFRSERLGFEFVDVDEVYKDIRKTAEFRHLLPEVVSFKTTRLRALHGVAYSMFGDLLKAIRDHTNTEEYAGWSSKVTVVIPRVVLEMVDVEHEHANEVLAVEKSMLINTMAVWGVWDRLRQLGAEIGVAKVGFDEDWRLGLKLFPPVTFSDTAEKGADLLPGVNVVNYECYILGADTYGRSTITRSILTSVTMKNFYMALHGVVYPQGSLSLFLTDAILRGAAFMHVLRMRNEKDYVEMLESIKEGTWR